MNFDQYDEQNFIALSRANMIPIPKADLSQFALITHLPSDPASESTTSSRCSTPASYYENDRVSSGTLTPAAKLQPSLLDLNRTFAEIDPEMFEELERFRRERAQGTDYDIILAMNASLDDLPAEEISKFFEEDEATRKKQSSSSEVLPSLKTYAQRIADLTTANDKRQSNWSYLWYDTQAPGRHENGGSLWNGTRDLLTDKIELDRFQLSTVGYDWWQKEQKGDDKLKHEDEARKSNASDHAVAMNTPAPADLEEKDHFIIVSAVEHEYCPHTPDSCANCRHFYSLSGPPKPCSACPPFLPSDLLHLVNSPTWVRQGLPPVEDVQMNINDGKKSALVRCSKMAKEEFGWRKSAWIVEEEDGRAEKGEVLMWMVTFRVAQEREVAEFPSLAQLLGPFEKPPPIEQHATSLPEPECLRPFRQKEDSAVPDQLDTNSWDEVAMSDRESEWSVVSDQPPVKRPMQSTGWKGKAKA